MSSLCDGVVRFLQDLPGPVLPSSLQADMIRAVQGETTASFPVAGSLSVIVLSLCTPLLSVCRGPGPGRLCPGAEGRGQLTHLPGPVWPDPAECGPAPGPSLSPQL